MYFLLCFLMLVLVTSSQVTDGSHTIRSAIVQNPMLHANLIALSFIKLVLWAIDINIAGPGILDVFWLL